jgi:hypothetical protein
MNKKNLTNLGIDVILLILLIFFTWNRLLEYSGLDKDYIPELLFCIIIICGIILLVRNKKTSEEIEHIFEKLKIYVWIYRILIILSIFIKISDAGPVLLFVAYVLQTATVATDVKLFLSYPIKDVK